MHAQDSKANLQMDLDVWHTASQVPGMKINAVRKNQGLVDRHLDGQGIKERCSFAVSSDCC